MVKKIIRRKQRVSNGCLPADLNPVLARVYAARAIESAGDLEYSLDKLLPLTQLGGLAAAVALLESAIRENKRIVVVGDFDADGATSCALCLRALRMMGAKEVQYLVPNRF